MAYTQHGHHIEDTDFDNPPTTVARCGGFICCSTCMTDAETFWKAQNHLLEAHDGHGDIFDLRGTATSRKEFDPCVYEEVNPRLVNACQLTTSYLDFIEFLYRFEFAFTFDNPGRISIIGEYNGSITSRYEKPIIVLKNRWLVVEEDSMPYTVSNDQFVRQFHKVNPE